MIQTVNKLMESENTYLRKVGWFVYDRLNQEFISMQEVEELLILLATDKLSEQLEKEYEEGTTTGTTEGYAVGYDDGYFDGKYGRPYRNNTIK